MRAPVIWLSTRETLDWETPATRATSVIVIRRTIAGVAGAASVRAAGGPAATGCPGRPAPQVLRTGLASSTGDALPTGTMASSSNGASVGADLPGSVSTSVRGAPSSGSVQLCPTGRPVIV